jgi:very-short-patch-repair endonuclease
MDTRGFLAGNGYPDFQPTVDGFLSYQRRFVDITTAHYLVAWLGDRSDGWWGDIVYAQRVGKRIFVGDNGQPRTYMTNAFLLEQAAISFSGLSGKDELLALSHLFWIHDQKIETTPDFTMDWTKFLRDFSAAESPIEQRLFVHLSCALSGKTFCDLVPQVKIDRFRADFVVTSERFDDAKLFSPIRILIEADGHDFHERTKEQAARDKARDRALVADGWQVLRFTGSEIWNRPGECAGEVVAIISAKGGCI